MLDSEFYYLLEITEEEGFCNTTMQGDRDWCDGGAVSGCVGWKRNAG